MATTLLRCFFLRSFVLGRAIFGTKPCTILFDTFTFFFFHPAYRIFSFEQPKHSAHPFFSLDIFFHHTFQNPHCTYYTYEACLQLTHVLIFLIFRNKATPTKPVLTIPNHTRAGSIYVMIALAPKSATKILLQIGQLTAIMFVKLPVVARASPLLLRSCFSYVWTPMYVPSKPPFNNKKT